MSEYVELVFYASHTNCAIVRKISLEVWKLVDAEELTTNRQYFVYNIDDIKFYWKNTRKQSDNYDLPFFMEKLRITLKQRR